MDAVLIGIVIVICIVIVLAIVGIYWWMKPEYTFTPGQDCTLRAPGDNTGRVIEDWVNLETSIKRARELGKPAFVRHFNGKVAYNNPYKCIPWPAGTFKPEHGTYVLN